MIKSIIAGLFLFCATLLPAGQAGAAHGLSLDGALKYPPDFAGFDYTDPRARKGGTLTLHAIGGFDKMNPFTLKGIAPDMLNTLLFDTLMVQSQDEPFSQYGLVATDVEVAADGLSVTHRLDPDARFADGSPLTADDVRYSLEMMQSDKVHPFYQSYWRDVREAEVIDPHRVRFHFARKNRELPLIVGELPLFSRAFFAKHPFDAGGLTVPLGSGPYTVESFNTGKSITYRRNPDYWGQKRPVNRGLYNFDRIVVKYFKDPIVALEGFKAGEFDFIFENNSKQWARDYVGDKFDRKTIIKETLPHQRGAGMQGWVFNLRRPLFADRRVREALTLAFDFEWSNTNLFYSQYTRADSYFSNSELAARGAPGPEELALLEPFRDRLDPAVFQPVRPPPSTTAPGSLRGNLRRAAALLKEAGWRVGGPERRLLNAGGEPLEIDMLLVSQAFERVVAPYAANLGKLGITLRYRTVDPTLYQRRVDSFDYDMIVTTFGQSQSPGNEQRDMWHSASADQPGSRNHMGLKDPVVDALVEKIIYADDREKLVTACHALDRVLLAGHYLIPNWYLPYHRIAYWNRFRRPERPPLYYSPDGWLLSWWMIEDRTATP